MLGTIIAKMGTAGTVGFEFVDQSVDEDQLA
jgi:hypothetical protein